MSKRKEDSSRKKVPCAQCLKEVPVSEAKVAEAVDYVAYFCGLECYTKWVEQGKGTNACGQRTNALTLVK